MRPPPLCGIVSRSVQRPVAEPQMTTPDTGSPAGAARHVADRSVAEGRPFAAIGPASPCGTAVGPSLKNAGRLVGGARFSPLILWGALTAAIAYVLAVNPVDRKPDLLGGCSWYAMFGTNGPTCGGTRMVWYLLHGDLVNAARMHLVALIGTPFA